MRSRPADGLREHGDVQTPQALAERIVRRLAARGLCPARILEPTCGSGAFLRAARATFGADPQLIGVERHEARYGVALSPLAGARTTIVYADACAIDLATLLRSAGDGHALVVGNLPWVTTDALVRMGAGRGPRRGNPKALRGLDARTGASAFDLAEYLALRLFDALAAVAPRATFAVLLKESVARRLLRELHRRGLRVVHAAVARIDARRAFGVAADACLLEIDLAPEGARLARVAVAPSLDAPPSETWHVDDEIVTADAALAAPPSSALVWRQGLKHDAAAIFELAREGAALVNGRGERVDVEDEVVFPFVRARDLARGVAHDGRSYVLVPYRSLRGNEIELAARAPRAHAYLLRHAGAIDARRSSVYRSAPRFALFGVGPYAFAPYKVAVSGFHREPRFVVLAADRPIQLADTAYALAFARRDDAELVARVLASPSAQRALRAGIFAGKRPITKRLLARLDLAALAPEADAARVRELMQDEQPEQHDGAA